MGRTSVKSDGTPIIFHASFIPASSFLRVDLRMDQSFPLIREQKSRPRLVAIRVPTRDRDILGIHANLELVLVAQAFPSTLLPFASTNAAAILRKLARR